MKYIFLGYLNRSGSTYLLNQLSKSDKICVCPEADILYDALLKKPNAMCKPDTKNINFIMTDAKMSGWRLDGSELKKILSQKTYNYRIFLDIINLFHDMHYPEADYTAFKHNSIFKLNSCSDPAILKLIWWIRLIRDPFDTYASQKVTISPNTQRAMCQNVYEFYSNFRLFQGPILPNNIYNLRYEELINDYNRVLGDLFLFLGIKEDISDFRKKKGKVVHYMLPTYRGIHRSVDLPPDLTRIKRHEGVLTDYETYVLNKLCSLQEQKFTAYSPVVYFKYHLHLGFDILKYYTSARFLKKRLISTTLNLTIDSKSG
ncbi:MAG: hypothetical protein EHM20_03885 [Alphaproteobacteria bacterium]|nr:MAG: hypothetical protein EHM20_03885 [Alphaproteobacteria bacterium]